MAQISVLYTQWLKRKIKSMDTSEKGGLTITDLFLSYLSDLIYNRLLYQFSYLMLPTVRDSPILESLEVLCFMSCFSKMK